MFNLWKTDDRFRDIGLRSGLANWARQLLGAERVLLMEDNVVMKNGNTGRLPWHQDYSYWPLAEPSAVTVWIALDSIDAANGAMEVVPGSHEWGERLPVSFGDGIPFMAEDRPGITAVPTDPGSDNYEVVSYRLRPGECGLHSPMLWHGSAPNASPRPRRAFILRYVAVGTVWLGESRFPYDDIGCPVGSPLTEEHFPAAA
jgi:ectoine hydroxylase-related dioxygenase (phytanoyl-CoA dioxygenase family)